MRLAKVCVVYNNSRFLWTLHALTHIVMLLGAQCVLVHGSALFSVLGTPSISNIIAH